MTQGAPKGAGGKSLGAAAFGATFTLLGFAVVFMAFLVAPVIVLLVAYGIYAVMRSRGDKAKPASSPAGPPVASHDFGAGAA